MLSFKVITSSPEGFSVNSTLVFGEKEALLIDAQFTLSDAHRLAAIILETKKHLKTIFITHGHPDHYFGLTVLAKAFPDARIFALPSVVTDIRNTWKDKVDQWKPLYGDNIPNEPVIPQPLMFNKLVLEDEDLIIHGDQQADSQHNSFVWIPSLKAAVVGDVAYNGVFPWTADTSKEQRLGWIKTLKRVVALKPVTVVAGHKMPALPDDQYVLAFTQNYLENFDQLSLAARDADEFKQAVRHMYPTLGLEVILDFAADALFPRKVVESHKEAVTSAS